MDRKSLELYAREATNYATEGAFGETPFEKNHRGENDVALFDFTSLFASENAARVVERKGKKILLCLVGDSLLEVCTKEKCKNISKFCAACLELTYPLQLLIIIIIEF